MKQLQQQKRAPYFFIAPFFILFFIFGIYPIGYSITMSLFKWNLQGAQGLATFTVNEGESYFGGLWQIKETAKIFKGFGNYFHLILKDPFFKRSFITTFIILVTGNLLQHFFAVPLAIFLNSPRVKGREFFKSAYFLPFITSSVVVVLIFGQFYDFHYGWFNHIFTHWFGLQPVRWSEDVAAIRASIAIILNWRFIGWNTIIYLAGLQAIDRQLYEAAEIDGASSLQAHLKITLPLLLPIMFFGLTMSIIGGMQIFEEPFVLLGGSEGVGGVGNAGLTVSYYLYLLAFPWNRMGKASAVAWILFIIIITLTVINKKVTDKLQG